MGMLCILDLTCKYGIFKGDINMEHLRLWVNNLLNSLEVQVDKEISKKVIEKCGRICANECGAITEVEEIKRSLNGNKDIDIILERMNQKEIGGGNLKRENQTIYGIYEKCYCPSRNLIDNKNYCSCTLGWTKEVFEKVLEKPVQTTLLQSIARGDKICMISIKY